MKQLLIAWLLVATLPVYAQDAPASFRPVFTNQSEIGLLMGRVVFGQAQQQSEVVQQKINLTLQTFNGVQLTPRLAVGATVGADWYNGTLLMPLGGGVRYELARKAQKAVRVYAGLDAGYSTNWLVKDINGTKTTGGLFASPTVGLRLGHVDRSNLTISFSYRYQRASIAYLPDSYYLQRSEERTYNRLAVRLGVGF